MKNQGVAPGRKLRENRKCDQKSAGNLENVRPKPETAEEQTGTNPDGKRMQRGNCSRNGPIVTKTSKFRPIGMTRLRAVAILVEQEVFKSLRAA